MSVEPLSGRSEPAAAWVLAALVAASVLLTPPARDLFAGDETRYARITAEMSAANEWLVPILDGEPYTEKPPVHFWFLILGARAFGFDSTWPYVLPSILSFAGLVLLVGWSARRWWGAPAGAVAALVFSTFLLAWGSAQTARMDMEYALLATAALLSMHEGFVTGKKSAMLACGALTGAAVLVKGTAILAIVVLVFAVESGLRRRRPRWTDMAALAIALALPLAWVAAMRARLGGWIAFDLVVTQSFGRAVDSWAHAQPPWHYAARYPALFFPWSALVVLAAVDVLRGREGRDAPEGFSARWLLIIFVFFSLVSGKLDVYLLPALVPAAFIVARWTTGAEAPLRKWGIVANGALAGALAVLAGIGAVAGARFLNDTPELRRLEGHPWRIVLGVACVVAACAAAVHATRSLSAHRSVLWTALASIAPFALGAALLPAYFNDVNSSRPLIRELQRLGASDGTIVLYEAFHPWGRNFPFDSPRIRTADPWTLKKAREGELPRIVVSRDSRTTELGKPLRERYRHAGTARVKRKNYEVFELVRGNGTDGSDGDRGAPSFP